ncbi:hypothetical protein MMMB2_0550 [Mycobacterium marinum MB2]|nr:hypothetical protein MMSP_4053 [Mycobacterium sp. 012931]EPQ75890.1 hypothetical protein MMMB2_0550 [Mycobacterium marinum MB2]
MAMACDTSSPPAASTLVVGAATAALAAPNDVPMFATSCAAALTSSGVANTNAIEASTQVRSPAPTSERSHSY